MKREKTITPWYTEDEDKVQTYSRETRLTQSRVALIVSFSSLHTRKLFSGGAGRGEFRAAFVLKRTQCLIGGNSINHKSMKRREWDGERDWGEYGLRLLVFMFAFDGEYLHWDAKVKCNLMTEVNKAKCYWRKLQMALVLYQIVKDNRRYRLVLNGVVVGRRFHANISMGNPGINFKCL